MSRAGADLAERRLDRKCQVTYTTTKVRDLLVLWFAGAKDSSLAPEPGMRKAPAADPATQGDLMAELADLHRAVQWAIRTETIAQERFVALWLYFGKGESESRIGQQYGVTQQTVSAWLDSMAAELATAMTFGMK